MVDPIFDDPMLVPASDAPSLDLINFYVAEIDPKVCGSTLPALTSAVPLGLRHAKRVRKLQGTPTSVEILICPVENEGETHKVSAAPPEKIVTSATTRGNQQERIASLDDLPAAAAAVLRGVARRLFIAQVPRHAPCTKEDQASWSELHWPVSLGPPDKVTLRERADMSIEEKTHMRHHMRAAWELAHANASQGHVCNACIIVNPATNEVVGQGSDETHRHPLKHAAMVTIEKVADWQRKTYYSGSHGEGVEENEEHSKRRRLLHSSLGEQRSDLERRTGSSAVTSCNSERGPMPGQNSKEQPGAKTSCSRSDTATNDGSNKALASTTEATPQRNGTWIEGSIATPTRAPLPADAPYLCTGYDCYVVQEPCWMCAMALVHSRLRRVIFCMQDEKGGALGGSGHQLHSRKSLNHHYTVFRLPLQGKE